MLSDSALFDHVFRSCSVVPKMFLRTNTTKGFDICLIKIVHNLLATGSDDRLRLFVNNFGKKFTLDSVACGPGCLFFFGFSVVQQEDVSSKIDGYVKL